MVRLFNASTRVLLGCLLTVLLAAGVVQAEKPAPPPKVGTADVPEDQKRYLLYVFYNSGMNSESNFSWTPVETALRNGCNGIELCVPWDEIYLTRNGPANWTILDQEIDRIVQLGGKVALRIGLHRTYDRVDTFWSDENGAHTYKNEVLYKNNARQFTPAYQPTVDLASDFVKQVAQRYSAHQQQGHILFMSVTNTPFLEQEYSATSMIRYQAGETPTVTDYSSSMIIGFRAWLAAKYGSIGALNTAWGRSYGNFYEIAPPGYMANDINDAFIGKPGKDWYVYRHKVHKTFVDQTTLAIKSANSTYKVVNQHGSVFDNFSVFRGTLGFKNYAQNADGVKVNDTPDYPHRFTMDLARSNVSTGKWIMNEVDGQGYARIGVNTFADQITQSFQHGAKAVVFANFADAGGLEFVRLITQQVRLQGWLDQPVPDFAPNGDIGVKLSKLVESGYNQLGIQAQWQQIYNQNGNKPVRITIDEDLLSDAPVATPTNPLTLLTPTVDCATGLLTFRTSGGDGTLIEYFAVGLRPWGSSPTATLESWTRTGVTYTLQARQSGWVTSLDYTTNCAANPTPPAANKAPVVVAAIASQTATLARSYSLVIPPGTFTDPDGQLVSWAVSGLPVGLSFDAPSRTISGSPSLIGASVVTVTVTDNGGATAQTSFSLQVLGNNTPTPPAATTTTAPPTTTVTTPANPLTLLAPTVDCATGLLTFRTGGGDGTLIEYFAVGLRPWSSSPTATLESWLPDGVVFTLQARQSGKLVSRDYITNCRSLTVTPPVAANKAPVVVAAIASQTATLARSYSLVIPPGTFTDPDGQLVSWAVSGLPVGLSFDAPSRTISGSPSLIGASVVTVTVTDNGGATAQTSFSLQVLGNNTSTPPAATTTTAPPTTTVTTPANPLTLLAPTVDCATGLLTFRTGGGDGTLIEYFAVGLRPWSSSPHGHPGVVVARRGGLHPAGPPERQACQPGLHHQLQVADGDAPRGSQQGSGGGRGHRQPDGYPGPVLQPGHSPRHLHRPRRPTRKLGGERVAGRAEL